MSGAVIRDYKDGGERGTSVGGGLTNDPYDLFDMKFTCMVNGGNWNKNEREENMREITKLLILGLLLMMFCGNEASADGSLSGWETCPAPTITGTSQSIVFTLQGPTPPDGARITVVTGTCVVNGGSPFTTLDYAGQFFTISSDPYTTNIYAGLPTTGDFQLRMSVGGDYGEPTGMLPGICQINVSWTDPAPIATEISGPTQVEIGQIVELDGTVEFVSSYGWATAGECTIEDDTDLPTVLVKGGHLGDCLVARAACNRWEECTTDIHDLRVAGQTWMIMVRHLLLF